MNGRCRFFGHNWRYTRADNIGRGKTRSIAVRECTRCGYVERRGRTDSGGYAWVPAKLVNK